MVGLDIGDHGAAASLLGFGRGGKISLKAAGTVSFDMKASEREVAAAIRKLWKKSGFASYTVCAGIHSDSLLWKTFSYPDLTEDEVHAALQLDAEEYTQMPSDNLSMDVHLYDTEGDGCEGFYVAVPRHELTRLLHILDMAKLFPVIVDVSAMAVANLFMRFKMADLCEDAVCVVCLEGHHADILVLREEECVYARSIAAHSAQMHNVSVYISEVLMEVIELSRLAMESTPVKAVYCLGNEADLEETMNATRQLTGLPVVYWDPLQDVKLTHHAKQHCHIVQDAGGQLVGSLGLGLRRAR
jgi:Tfp pilus assembly PilM family ATPase